MDVLPWLLDSDPAIRWQVMRDLVEEPVGTVAAERSRVATEGWGARLLSLQEDNGQWGGGAYSPKWISTTYTLLLLRHMGLDPQSPEAKAGIALVRGNVVMGEDDRPFFAYFGETCITGMCLALASYFGATEDGSAYVVDWLLDEQLEDGGWNCRTVRGSTRSSFNTTISVLEGLIEYERSDGAGAAAIAEVRARAQEYLLERRMFRSRSSGNVIDSRWKLLSFPPRWHYDILRGLDYLRDAEVPPDDRCDEAVEIVRSKRDADGRWPLQNHHPGREHFQMEPGPGRPSRWNTLRALRVLRWHSGDIGESQPGS